MKARIITLGLATLFAFSAKLSAQQTSSLLADQNPRHQEALAKYIAVSDSLTQTQGTTVQATYKAYDWYEAREERRKQRRERNYQYDLYSYPYYQNSYYQPYSGYYGNFGYTHWSGRNRFWYGW